jgi:ribosomal protein S18 acetylase RimI-like enzyme
MYTSPDCRNQGIASALLAKAIELGQEAAKASQRAFLGTIVVDQVNKRATELYMRLGFVVIRNGPFGDTGRTALVLKYEPQLTASTN